VMVSVMEGASGQVRGVECPPWRGQYKLRRVLHFLSLLVLTSHSRDFSLSVQDVILDSLGFS